MAATADGDLEIEERVFVELNSECAAWVQTVVDTPDPMLERLQDAMRFAIRRAIQIARSSERAFVNDRIRTAMMANVN